VEERIENDLRFQLPNSTLQSRAPIGAIGNHEERETRRGHYHSGLKRLFDVAVVLLALPFVLPLIALLALMIWSDGSNPFYAQERVGRSGRVFRMWKLRSMVPNADRSLEEYLRLNASARREWNEYQKLRNDPRITRIGQVIRKTSIDELPQLFNVLIGDMSLVGPRPIMVDQTELYPGSAYFELRPGVTGYWQVADRNEAKFASRAVFDTKYAQDCSFMVDLSVLVRTVSVVMKANGR
jgi:lipopolysaccharide/colanic/teichoic acid biosynthesis glycosyltransferase